jgi:hypothetical protein
MLTAERINEIEANMLEFEASELSMAHIPVSIPDVLELVKMARLAMLVTDKFASGNSVPVERITIKREEFEALEGIHADL